MNRQRSSWLILGLMGLLAVLSAGLSVSKALAQGKGDADEESPKPARGSRPSPRASLDTTLSPQQRAERRAEIVARRKSDETVLINVTAQDMPASPDIVNLGRKTTKALSRCVTDNVDESRDGAPRSRDGARSRARPPGGRADAAAA